MEKIKLAICMKDLEYQDRFVNCFLDHYKQQYELHVFTDLERLKSAKPHEYTAIIMGEYSTEEMASFVERGEILLALEDYQEVYRTEEQIALLVANHMESKQKSSRGSCKKTGVFSLTQGQYQAPFAVLLAKLYGEREKVLILDLQSYSGIHEGSECASSMGLEDLMSAAMTGKYSRGRILECICHASAYDYVAPVQNNQCITEGTGECFVDIMDTLAKEFGYERFVINFGTGLSGLLEQMEQCEDMFFLCEKSRESDWRESAFLAEVERLEKNNLLKNVQRVELSLDGKQENSWQSLVERWTWGPFAERVKAMMQRERAYGSVV